MNSSSGFERTPRRAGLRFAERANPDAARPVCEVVGFDRARNLDT